jgi:hypothetical protein
MFSITIKGLRKSIVPKSIIILKDETVASC